MIDLHCHILPGLDDGAPDMETSLAMARLAVADGITVTACTPHITPGVYDNRGPAILDAITALQRELDAAGIPLVLTSGADIHLAPGLRDALRSGRTPSLGGTRYFLLEPPHHVAPPRLEAVTQDLIEAGLIPLVTHPERLTWIEDHYDTMMRLADAGALMQITAGSVTGRFGKRPRYWAERMLDDGLVHVLATDAHNLRNRAPSMAEARDRVAARLGPEEATRMVLTRPKAVLANAPPRDLPSLVSSTARRPRGLMSRLFQV